MLIVVCPLLPIETFSLADQVGNKSVPFFSYNIYIISLLANTQDSHDY